MPLVQRWDGGRGEQVSAIVFCIAREDCEKVAAELRAKNIRAEAYHAGVADRSGVQTRWQKYELPVVVCTVAFGMGIDNPRVRRVRSAAAAPGCCCSCAVLFYLLVAFSFTLRRPSATDASSCASRWHNTHNRLVVHYDIAMSVPGFYQESGRAGRDGEPSQSILFYSSETYRRQMFIVRKNQREARTHGCSLPLCVGCARACGWSAAPGAARGCPLPRRLLPHGSVWRDGH